MPLNLAFRVSSILLAATAFAGLTFAGEPSVWVLTVGGLALAVSFLRTIGMSLFEPISKMTRISATTWNILLILAFVGFWIDLLWISQNLLSAGIHFLIALLVNKLFNLHQRRDFLHLYAISLMGILASAALTNEVWFASIFLVYLLAAVWTLLLYHLTKETEESASRSATTTASVERFGSTSRITARFFWTTNGMALGAFCLTLAIFFTLPRIGAGFFQKHRGEGLRMAGFSEKVDLGAIGSIKLDPSIVMRVELPEVTSNQVERLYLRGAAYDRYTGNSWSNSFTHRRLLVELPMGTFKTRGSSAGGAAAQESPILRQDILLEPLDTPVLFGAPFIESITGELLTVQADTMGALYLPYPSGGRTQYSVASRVNHLLLHERMVPLIQYPDAIRKQYLQLPTLDPQVAELTRQIVKRANTPHERVTAIKQHLLQNYHYRLDVGPSVSSHPLEEFLFQRKTGYCEHYATAMVIMLRTVGIPARLVTGFLATEWNDFGNYFTVRQQDAHAWVEVFFPLSGWITVDPTPAAGAAPSDLWWLSFGRMMDSARLRWDRFFVQYSGSDQLAVVQGIREGSHALRMKLSDSLAILLAPVSRGLVMVTHLIASVNLPQFGFMLTIVLIGFILLGWLISKGPWRTLAGKRSPSVQQATATKLYRRMIRLAGSHGIRQSASMTPTEFLQLVKRHWQEAGPQVEVLTHLYCRVRFGQAPLTTEDLVLAEDLLLRLRTIDRPTRSGHHS